MAGLQAAAGGPLVAATMRAAQTAVPALRAKGWAVVDNVFGQDYARRMRDEVTLLAHDEAMHQNATHLVQGGKTELLFKQGIFEAELADAVAHKPTAIPTLRAFHADRSLLTMIELMLDAGLHRQAVKLQYNKLGCFPVHFDSDVEMDPRVLTAIVYLNEGWSEGDGGELRLYPGLRQGQKPVNVQPVMDRMVLFSSPNMLHRVLPSQRDRFCFTIWFHSRRKHMPAAPVDPPAASGEAEPAGALRFLMQPHVRKHVARLVFADEWEQSIVESHPASQSRDQAVEKHRSDVVLIQKALGKYLPALALAKGPDPPVKWF